MKFKKRNPIISLKRKRPKLKPKRKSVNKAFLKRGITFLLNVMVAVLIVLTVVGYQQDLTDRLETLEDKLEKLDLANLESKIKTQIDASVLQRDDAISLANTSLNQIVASDVNRYNNEAQESYNTFLATYETLNTLIKEYKAKHKKAEKIVEEINEIKEELNDSEKKVLKNYLFIVEESLTNLSNSKAEAEVLLAQCQQNADNIFNEYYPYMLKVVTCECGSDYCPDLDQYLVMKVVENRIKSNRYPNSIQEVIFQKGQYACTWDGSWETKIPDERTTENVRKYLRGEVDTGAPDNLLYQAMFVQGPVYAHVTNPVDGGHYFCLG